MKRRLILLACVALGLAPGTWVRSAVPPPDYDSCVAITRLTDLPPRLGPFVTLNAWELDSNHHLFGSYSALRATAPGEFLTASDRGNVLRFTIEGDRLGIGPMARFNGEDRFAEKRASDIEALAIDPKSGTVWAAYEGLNAIERRDARLRSPTRVRPPSMQDWRSNSGPEAMLRFDDGRFIVIGEGTTRWTDDRMPAVLFARDPAEGDPGMSFAFSAPEDFRPTDIAALPDGRVLFLLRRIVFGLPPRFEIGLLVADPAQIAEGETWSGELLTVFSRPFPTDNYEGLAVEPTDGGYPVTITMISDDNDIAYQRTLVAQLYWDGRAGR
ncbi:esterase-like activity of phytase family protein [Erythrobacter litoralis]|uniref:esterase-like activity of phytase family protein n=1 Tax=Erythrobacter litoralis TaxID=39960 RepID=UPI0018C8CE0F|nr:esterase-like activity of phytase family protein [Erythrobacter litoralis]